jgi:hypothetical protein
MTTFCIAFSESYHSTVVNLAYEGGGGVGKAFLLAAQGDSLLQTVEEGLRCVEHCNKCSPFLL